MTAFVNMPPLTERADTPTMNKLLHCVAECEKSLIEIRLPRLVRKMGEAASAIEVSNLINTAEIAGWVELKTNSLGYVMDVWLTQEGRDLIGQVSLGAMLHTSDENAKAAA